MEIEWEDRGRIAHDMHLKTYGMDGFDFEKLNNKIKHRWNRVFDACRKAETRTIPGGKTILITGDKNNG
jgi:hypothetical protein